MSLGPVNGQPLPPAGPEEEGVAELVALAYELLDAHADTARLYADGSGEAEWSNPAAYLRDLQRVGRETLARVASEQRSGAPAGA